MTLRCPACRSRRATYQSLQAHIDATGHKLCACGGYHYAHRPGSPCCTANPRSAYNLALRADEPDEVLQEILVEMAWHHPGLPLRRLADLDMVLGFSPTPKTLAYATLKA